MAFETVGEIIDVKNIAIGDAIREIARLEKRYGKGRCEN